MTETRRPEQREGAETLQEGDLRVRAGFRLLTEDPLASGPVELEFFVECLGPAPLELEVSGDRARGRPDGFSFSALFAGEKLSDPMEGLPDLGGPMGVVTVTAQTPWRQTLALNQFVRLERTRELLADGETDRLELLCRRPLPLDGAQEVAVALSFDLRRNDAALRIADSHRE